MNNKNENSKRHVPYASRLQLAISVALGPICIAVYALLCELVVLDKVFIAVGVTLIYLLSVALIATYHTKHHTSMPTASLEALMEEQGSMIIRNISAPVITLDSYGTVLWYNQTMSEILDPHGNFIGFNINSIFGSNLSRESFNGEPVELFGRLYKMESFAISESDDGLHVLMLSDITELSEALRKYEDERAAVAYIAIDNVDDVLQYVHDKFRDSISSVDDKLKAWAESMNGVLKSYDNDKYIMVFESSRLEECRRNRFEILDTIRDSRVSNGVSITVSIGVSGCHGTLASKEKEAREAIDMALQRGGDQVVYKTEDAIEYYGGRTKSIYKKSNVRSRTFANQLSAIISRSDNVIVMGHRYGDFDSIGASIGVARLAMILGIKVNIAVDMRDENLRPSVAMMMECENYSQVFVDSAEAFDLIGPDTLVVLVDHNTLDRAQFPDIAKKVNNVVIIDHHRKGTIMPESVKLSYIEPSASSTCELLAEMLEVSVTSQNLTKQEADIILAGILLDTKQFTRNTGTRTFGAAQYLRGIGANPTDVYDMFKTSPLDLAKEARFHTAITIYKNNIAIACCDGDTDESYRVIASKAADKMLTLKNVEAAFTLVKIGEQIHISGRSNGKINVQVILEKLNGGGHFDIAGAQMNADSVMTVLKTLKESIDDFLDVVEKEKAEKKTKQ